MVTVPEISLAQLFKHAVSGKYDVCLKPTSIVQETPSMSQHMAVFQSPPLKARRQML